MQQFSLAMRGIYKSFPGVQALSGVDFDVRPNEVHALLGINGAGKSTLIKILAGIYQKDDGEIAVNGQLVEINSPIDARQNGIATVYQDPQMIPTFTGFENIFLGAETKSRSVFSRINRANLRKRAQDLLDKYSFDVDISRPVEGLEPVEKEIIAVLRALAQEQTTILVLDEPTSILTGHEIEVLFKQIKSLKEAGVSIIFITHRLDEVFQIADRFTVLRDGKTIGTYDVSQEIDSNLIAELMLGEKLQQIYPDRSYTVKETVLRVKDLTLQDEFTDISFDVHHGEILGIFGLVGSGFDQLCKCIFGIKQPTSGEIIIKGKTVNHRTSADAINNGLFLIPGDRRSEGQILDESVSFNVSLANMKRVSGLTRLIQRKQEKREVQNIVNSLNIKTPTVEEEVALLSGGNQQKVVIGKGLFTDSDIYIFEEPTIGVDVGAKAGIYHQIRELSKEKGVVVVSSDCEEVYGLCDRAIVLYKGQIVCDKPISEAKLEELLLYGLTGGSSNGNN